MSNCKKILLTLPEDLLSEIDSLLTDPHMSRSEFIRKGLRFYVAEQKKIKIRELLKKGYREIGSVNLRIAEDCLSADNLQLETYLEMLSECEK